MVKIIEVPKKELEKERNKVTLILMMMVLSFIGFVGITTYFQSLVITTGEFANDLVGLGAFAMGLLVVFLIWFLSTILSVLLVSKYKKVKN